MEPRLRAWVEQVLDGELRDSRRGFAGGSRELWFIEVEREGARCPLVLRQETGVGAFAGTPLSLQREATVYRALHGTDVPVAELVAASPDGSALVLEHLPGRSRLDDVSDADAGPLVGAFMEAIASLHALDPAELDLDGFDRPTSDRDHALLDLSLWAGIARDHISDADPLVEYGLAWLERNAPSGVQRSVLVQGDTGPGNFMHDDRSVTGLVDWEFAHVGDPMDDLAWIDMRSGASGPFADTARRDRSYERATGLDVDHDAVRYYSALVQLRCAITTGLTISRGGGAVGLAGYLAPHHRFVAQLGVAIADAIGFDASVVDAPDGEDTPMTAVYDHAIDGLRSVVMPELADRSARLSARAALLVLEHDRAVERMGDQLAAADRDDMVATLGRCVEEAELCDLASTAGADGDRAFLDLLCRRAQRARFVWDTAGAGGPTSLRPPVRSR